MTVQESSLAKNIANLQRANQVNRSLGSRYAPGNQLIHTAVIDAYCTDCEQHNTGAYSAEREFETATEARQLLFKGLAPYGTRIANSLRDSGATEGSVDEATSLVRKMRGQRASKPKKATTSTPAADIVKQISVAQTSYDSQVEHLRKLVALCSAMGTAYAPAAADMQTAALEERFRQLKAANSKVASSAANYSSVLIDRDRFCYDPISGLVVRLEAIRTHYKSVFGAASAERRMLNGISIRNRSNKNLSLV